MQMKYDLTGAEIIKRDCLVQADTYADGEALKSGTADSQGLSSIGAGDGSFYGVAAEGGTTTGTGAAGTMETLQVIVNPFAVYSVEIDQTTPITWGTVTDTTIPFTCASGEGFPNAGGGWAWSNDTGELDYIVSSATSSTTCTLTTVTGTTTTSDYGFLVPPVSSGMTYVVELNAAATMIDGSQVDAGTAGTNGLDAIIGDAHIVSQTYGIEKLLPASMNQVKRIDGTERLFVECNFIQQSLYIT